MDDAGARAAALSAAATAAHPVGSLPTSGGAGGLGTHTDAALLGAAGGVDGHPQGTIAAEAKGSNDASSAAAALSRELVASWADQYAPALTLLKRVLPPGLIRCLNAPHAPSAAGAAAASNATAAAASASATTASAAISATADSHAGGKSGGDAPQQYTLTGSGGPPIAVSGGGGGGPLSSGAPAPSAAADVASDVGAGSIRAPVQGGVLLPPSQHASVNTAIHTQQHAPGLIGYAGNRPGTSGASIVQQQQQQQGDVSPLTAGIAEAQTVEGAGWHGPSQQASAQQHHLHHQPPQQQVHPLPAQGHTGGENAVAAGPDGRGGEGRGGKAEGSRSSLALHAKGSGGGLRGNWGALWRALALDHYNAGLIWNEATRGELRGALAAEEMALRWACSLGFRSATVCVRVFVG